MSFVPFTPSVPSRRRLLTTVARSPNLTKFGGSDGRRFLVNTVIDQPTHQALTVIFNSTAGLKK